MNQNEKIFLTVAQAVRAIDNDFRQYKVQFDLFQELCPALTDNRKVVVPKSRDDCILITRGKKSKESRLSKRELGHFLVEQLQQKVYPLPLMAEICSKVFQTPSWAGRKEGSGEPGIWIKTEMVKFKCRQCGNCCRNLVYQNDCTQNDYRRWQLSGRSDILERVLVLHPAGVRSPVYKIWIHPGTRHYYSQCPWLISDLQTNKFICKIQDVKPEFCRQYPLTRKHAVMTGCKGVFGNRV